MLKRENYFENDEYYESGWFFNWYIDACHAGSCKDETEKWLMDQKDCSCMVAKEGFYNREETIKEGGTGGALNKYSENGSECKLYYFDRNAYLEL